MSVGSDVHSFVSARSLWVNYLAIALLRIPLSGISNSDSATEHCIHAILGITPDLQLRIRVRLAIPVGR